MPPNQGGLMIGPKLRFVFSTIVIALILVLFNQDVVMALPLDPSEIPIGNVTMNVLKWVVGPGGGMWVLKRVITGRWFADGHYESVDSDPDNDK